MWYEDCASTVPFGTESMVSCVFMSTALENCWVRVPVVKSYVRNSIILTMVLHDVRCSQNARISIDFRVFVDSYKKTAKTTYEQYIGCSSKNPPLLCQQFLFLLCFPWEILTDQNLNGTFWRVCRPRTWVSAVVQRTTLHLTSMGKWLNKVPHRCLLMTSSISHAYTVAGAYDVSLSVHTPTCVQLVRMVGVPCAQCEGGEWGFNIGHFDFEMIQHYIKYMGDRIRLISTLNFKHLKITIELTEGTQVSLIEHEILTLVMGQWKVPNRTITVQPNYNGAADNSLRFCVCFRWIGSTPP